MKFLQVFVTFKLNTLSPLSCANDSVPSIPKKLQSLRDELRETLAGKHALKMYHQHRFALTNANQSTLSYESKHKSKCVRGKALGFNFVVPKSIRRNQISWIGLGTSVFIVGTGLWAGVTSYHMQK